MNQVIETFVLLMSENYSIFLLLMNARGQELLTRTFNNLLGIPYPILRALSLI